MSPVNTETVRVVYDAFGRGDMNSLMKCFHADWEMSLPYVPEPGPYRGWEGFAHWTTLIADEFESYRIEPIELIAAGEQVLARVHLITKGRVSGVETDIVEAHLWTLHEGKVKTMVAYQDEALAFEAAGLKSRSPSE